MNKIIILIMLLTAIQASATGSDGSNGVYSKEKNGLTCLNIKTGSNGITQTGSDGSNGITQTGSDGSNGITQTGSDGSNGINSYDSNFICKLSIET